MKQELTKDQIDRLFAFCKKHFVYHYDVQAELVDHLANAIEGKKVKNTQLSFEAALDSVYAGFGVLGFAGIVNARSEALSKYCNRLKKKLFFSYFTWPKATMTVCLFLLLMLPLQFFTSEQLSSFTRMIFFLIFIFELFVLIENTQRLKKQKNKLLITQVFHYKSWLTGFLLVQIVSTDYHGIFNNKSHTVVVIFYGLMILLSILFLISILAFRNMNLEADKLARKQYPEIFENV